MEEETLVFALATQDFLYEKMVSNVEEIKARGARVVAIAKEGRTEIEQVADEVIYIPPCMDEVSPVLADVYKRQVVYRRNDRDYGLLETSY